MALTDIQPVQDKPKQGGGLWGQIIGGLVGLAAAPFTGGASLAVGPMAGQMIGEAANPSKPGDVTQPNPTSKVSMPMQTISAHPEVQLAQMQNSRNLLKQTNIPNAEDYIGMLDEASNKLKTRLG